jgi:putative GTP pyrophosphokinase
MAKPRTKQSDRQGIEDVIATYNAQRHLFETFAKTLCDYLMADAKLKPYIHFIKYRTKDPEHLRAKLARKTNDGISIDSNSLFDQITDLAGVRILHLHTDQLKCTRRSYKYWPNTNAVSRSLR